MLRKEVSTQELKDIILTILTLFGSIVKDANTDVQYVNTTYPVLAKFAQ